MDSRGNKEQFKRNENNQEGNNNKKLEEVGN